MGIRGLTSVTDAEPEHRARRWEALTSVFLRLCRPEPPPAPHCRVRERRIREPSASKTSISEGPAPASPRPAHWKRRGLGLRRLPLAHGGVGSVGGVAPPRWGLGSSLSRQSWKPRGHRSQGEGPGDGDAAHREGHGTRVTEKLWRKGRGSHGGARTAHAFVPRGCLPAEFVRVPCVSSFPSSLTLKLMFGVPPTTPQK